MSEAWQSEIRSLIDECRVGFLATSGHAGPESSMAPYVIHDGEPLLHLSDLARHTHNIKQSPQAGLMICKAERGDASPLSLPRLSLQGALLPLVSDQLKVGKQIYLASIPEAAPLFDFGDFGLYRFSITSIYWVGGFGSAREVFDASVAAYCK